MKRFLPKTRVEWFALTAVILWGLKTWFAASRLLRSAPWIGFLLDLALMITGAVYFWRVFKHVRERLLWRIRRRLFLAHVFIGAIPVCLVIFIFWIAGLLFYYQLSYYLISNQIGIHASQLLAFNLSFREGLRQIMVDGPSRTKLQAALDADARYLLATYPTASIILSYKDARTNRRVALANRGPMVYETGEYEPARWVGSREFSGLVIDDTQKSHESKRRLYLKSMVSGDFPQDTPFSLEVSVPFDRYILDRIKAALGQDLILARHIGRPGISGVLQKAEIPVENVVDSTLESDPLRMNAAYPIFLFPVSWATGAEIDLNDSQVLLVELSTARLMQILFRSENVTSRSIFGVLQIIFVAFILVEAASIIIGILLTRSITNAVHNLDRGTEFIKRGDFSHRIVVNSKDQLGALAASFNQMTEYVQQLVKERVEKERLERELEIAKEVQERLFPNRIPRMARLEVSGICLPARTVSGDYYDFMDIGDNKLGLVLSDICGKGISAALLMANLQATLRSNVLNVWTGGGTKGDGSVAAILEKVNRQIYSYTAANKFATLFYALFDERLQTFTYCNAGHNPPLYFSRGQVRRLKTGGTVIGIFADSKYEQETIHSFPGDLLVAYTDGIVESMNEYGEEFGEHRLVQLIEENIHTDSETLKEIIVSRVSAWTFAEERDDDMTLIIAKVTAPSEECANVSSNT